MKHTAALTTFCLLLTICPLVSAQDARTMTVPGESLVLAKTQPGSLCFDNIEPGSVRVRSTYKPTDKSCVEYTEGADYVVDYAKGTIARTETSRIPDFSKNVLYGQKDFNHTKFPGYTNHPFFVWVDYATTAGRPWTTSTDQTALLPKTIAKLKSGGPFGIVSYGDSITAGGEASTRERRFPLLFAEYLRKEYPKAQIEVKDVSLPGYASAQGISRWNETVEKTSPDLVLVGWGMNDHNKGNTEPDVFRKNLVTLVEMIRDRKGAEIILFSAFPPNDDWHHSSHRMHLYAKATKEAAAETSTAYADVYGVWMNVLKRKDQPSLLGNNINHPNDFGHWLYEQAFEALGL